MRGVVAAGEIGLDVRAQALLEGVRVPVADTVERPVQGGQVEAVRRVGYGGGDQLRCSSPSGSAAAYFSSNAVQSARTRSGWAVNRRW